VHDQLASLLALLKERHLLSRVTSLELRDGGVSIELIPEAPPRSAAQLDLEAAKQASAANERDERIARGAAPRFVSGDTAQGWRK